MNAPKNESIKGFTILIVCFVIAWVISWWAMIYFLKDWQERSAFGDMFGSVNALFSGAALAGVIYAIFLQRRELQLQRRELELTRDELHRSAEAQEKSEAALREQIKQMQEQSELQLMPFVVIGLRSNTGYILANAGNGAAINIKVDIIEHQQDDIELIPFETRITFLNKGQEQPVGEYAPFDLEGRDICIEFENINRKKYFIHGKFKDNKTEVENFGPKLT